MAKKKLNTRIVFSTNPDYTYEDENEVVETLPPASQKLIIRLDKKQRRGKKVTLIEGFVGTENDLKDLAKILKSKCGVGGSAKDNEIVIQGDFKDKVKQILTAEGYSCKISG